MQEEVAIINESAIQAFGFDSPENAIQQKLVIGDRERTIVGVVENFHWHSLKEYHVPYVISLTNVRLNPYISLRMNMSDIAGSLAQVESKFHSFYPDQPFEYFFADDNFNKQYQSEVQFGKIFFSFATLAIFIACAGLFALVSFSATLRIKEIGIRKVLGADVRHLLLLLSKEYVVLISLATLVSIPVIWYWGSLWLNNYATRIPIGVDLFVIPVMILIVIAALTVSQKTFTTAQANPVDSLRKE
jgi:putative ABC transport system permease protein